MRHDSSSYLSEIADYLAEDCSSAERASLEQWMAQEPAARALVEDLRRVRTRLRWRSSLNVDVNAMMERVAEAIGVAVDDGETVKLTDQKFPEYSGPKLGTGPQTLRAAQKNMRVFSGQPLSRRVWFVATAVVLGFAATVLVSWNVGAHHVSRYTGKSMMTYATGNGERATVSLPDGGTVMLNVASRLEVPLNYMAGNHTVKLVGEGLFSVPHHDRAPVTVIVGATTVRVLGTSFVMRHYPSDTTVIVAVRDGKVAVGSAVITAAQSVEVERDGRTHVRSSDALPVTFATGILTIDGMSLSAAIVELDRWYDADIRLGDPTLANRHVKGEFVAGSLADLAAILELTFNVRAMRDGRVLTLYPKQ
jgi:transmembrane sensor